MLTPAVEWVLTLSVFLYIAGTVLSVLEEWPKQGLTDTSFLTMFLWICGSLGVGYTGYLMLSIPFSVLGCLSLILTVYALTLKIRDNWRYWESLALRGISMRRKL